MLKIQKGGKSGASGGYYFNYYSRDALAPGFWFGQGADLLKLPLDVSRFHFDNLLDGFSADRSQKLVQNAGDEKRQGFWDPTFSVPKPVSVLYAFAPEHRDEIKAICEKVVRDLLFDIEQSFGLSRQGKAGHSIVPAALSFAVFHHETSRADEPQLHWHCVMINTGVREDGTTGALHTRPLYKHELELGWNFRQRLASELSQKLGLEISLDKDRFEIDGVPKQLCDLFSTRRRQIVSFMKEHNLQGGRDADRAAELTRGPKKHTPRELLFKAWASVARAHGFEPEQIESVLHRGQERVQKHEAPHQQGERGQQKETRKQKVASSHSKAQSKTKPRQHGEQSRSKKALREERKAYRAFERELRETTDRIFPEKQTREKLTKVAFALAYKHDVDRKRVAEAVDKLKLPVQRRFYRKEWAPLFPNAPRWSGLGEIRTPRIVIRNKRRRWGNVRAKAKAPSLGSKTGSVAIQERKLFPGAPEWSPVRNFSLPAVRVKTEKLKLPVPAKTETRKQRIHR